MAKTLTIKQSPSTIHVSIVMPCLNEEKTLPLCIEEAQTALRIMEEKFQYCGEVIVADNGSTDGSIEIAEKMGVRVEHVPIKGYGSALIAGISAAKSDFIIIGDSDYSHVFTESIPMVEKLREGYDLCIGNRFVKGYIQPGSMSWKNRYIGNPVLTGVLNLLFHTGLSDAHCGFRAFTKEAFDRMHLTARGMEFASEMVIKASLVNLKCTEIPVTMRPPGRDRPPHLRPLRDGWRHLRYIFMLSPSWLFFIPSLVFGMLGLIIFVSLLLQPEEVVVHISGLSFGDHWLMIAGMLLVASHQGVLFGLATTLYGIREGYRQPGKLLKVVYKYITLERMIVLGLFLILIGAALFVSVLVAWSNRNFNGLDQLRQVYAATIFGLIGLQNFFGSFLLAIIDGNEAEINIYRD